MEKHLPKGKWTSLFLECREIFPRSIRNKEDSTETTNTICKVWITVSVKLPPRLLAWHREDKLLFLEGWHLDWTLEKSKGDILLFLLEGLVIQIGPSWWLLCLLLFLRRLGNPGVSFCG